MILNKIHSFNQFPHNSTMPAPDPQHNKHDAALVYTTKPTSHEYFVSNNDAHPDFIVETSMSRIARPLQQTSTIQSETLLGTVSINDRTKKMVWRCLFEACRGKSIGRLQDLKRHYETAHEGSIVWCPVQDCERSEGVGGDPFPAARKDMLDEHVKRKHGRSAHDNLRGL